MEHTILEGKSPEEEQFSAPSQFQALGLEPEWKKEEGNLSKRIKIPSRNYRKKSI